MACPTRMPPPAKARPSVPKRVAPEKPSEPASSAPKQRPSKTVTIAHSRKVRTRSQVIYLPDDQIDALDRLSRETERSKSDLVREAVAKFVGSSKVTEPSDA